MPVGWFSNLLISLHLSIFSFVLDSHLDSHLIFQRMLAQQALELLPSPWSQWLFLLLSVENYSYHGFLAFPWVTKTWVVYWFSYISCLLSQLNFPFHYIHLPTSCQSQLDKAQVWWYNLFSSRKPFHGFLGSLSPVDWFIHSPIHAFFS